MKTSSPAPVQSPEQVEVHARLVEEEKAAWLAYQDAALGDAPGRGDLYARARASMDQLRRFEREAGMAAR